MSKKNDKITELSYSIEALEDEVESLEEELISKQERIVELLNENDRLTLSYEPYQPPGDEHENIGYYDLIEENEELRARLREYHNETIQLDQTLKAEKAKKIRTPKAGCISFDFWPLSDWIRLSLHAWSPGQAFQLCIGPFRLDFFAS